LPVRKIAAVANWPHIFQKISEWLPGGLVAATDGKFPRELSNFNLVDTQPIQIEGFENDYTLRIAALRELFEEAGILLTFNGNCRESNVVTVHDDTSLEDWRVKVIAEPAKFAELFSASSQADVNILVPWSNWLTPKSYPKRFDTLFFIAPLTTTDDRIAFCKTEMSEAEWVHPTEVIRRSSEKCEVSLPPPQFYELARLRLINDDSLIQYSNPTRIVPQSVQASDDDSLRCILMPEDHFYNHVEPESVALKEMKRAEIIPDKEIDKFRAIHRLTYKMKPLMYTGHELHVSNVSKMPHKMHLFYFAGSDFNDWL